MANDLSVLDSTGAVQKIKTTDDGTRHTPHHNSQLVDDAGNTLSSATVDNGAIPVKDPWLQHAIEVIKADYGVDVSMYQKNKDLLKFGRNRVVGTSVATIMTLPAGETNETYITDNTNGITHFSSSASGDTGSMVVEGHTDDGSGNLTFVVQTVTLAGQTKTALTTPLNRCTRIYNNGTTAWTGTIYVYRDDTVSAGVPQTATKVSCMVYAGEQQSEKASTSLSSTDYWILTSFTAHMLEKAAGYAEVHLEARVGNKVFRPKTHVGISNTTAAVITEFKPYIIIPANSDVRLTAIADGASTDVAGAIQGVLVKVVA